jgi:hypothetical protein
VNVTVVEVRRGKDGKHYPMRMPIPLADRQRARALAHGLVHRDGCSIRQAQKVMHEQYGLRRSVGIIAYDLREFTCPRCRENSQASPGQPVTPPGTAQEPQPEPVPAREPARVVRWGGSP